MKEDYSQHHTDHSKIAAPYEIFKCTRNSEKYIIFMKFLQKFQWQNCTTSLIKKALETMQNGIKQRATNSEPVHCKRKQDLWSVNHGRKRETMPNFLCMINCERGVSQQNLVLDISWHTIDDHTTVVWERCKDPWVSRAPLCCIHTVLMLFITRQYSVWNGLPLPAERHGTWTLKIIRSCQEQTHPHACMHQTNYYLMVRRPSCQSAAALSSLMCFPLWAWWACCAIFPKAEAKHVCTCTCRNMQVLIKWLWGWPGDVTTGNKVKWSTTTKKEMATLSCHTHTLLIAAHRVVRSGIQKFQECLHIQQTRTSS